MTAVMMAPMRRDLNLNSSPQAYEGSIKEELRQSILRHELVFRDQVRELHRLYWTQKHLMHEILWKDNSHVYTPRFLQNPLMSSLGQAHGADVLRELISSSDELIERPQWTVDLQLSADDFGVRERSGLRAEQSPNAHKVFDLEKPAMLEAGKGEEVACSSDRKTTSASKVTVGSEFDVDGTFRDNLGCISMVQNANADHSATNREQKSLCADAGSNTSIGTRYIYKRMQIDLNIAQDDESLHVLPNPDQTFPSSGTSVVDNNVKLLSDSSKCCQKECRSGNKFMESCISVQPSLESPSQSSIQIIPEVREDVSGIPGKIAHSQIRHQSLTVHSECQRPVVASVGSTDLPTTMVRDSGEKQTSYNHGSEEDTVSSHAIGEYPVGNQPDRMTGDDDDQLDSLDAENHTSKEKSEFSSNNTSLHKHHDEISHHVTIMAAETLICISSVNRNALSDVIRRDGPQYSADSFEKGILNLEEITDDELWRPAMPTETENRKDMSRIMLRRGRGLRDFQKEILPGLVSLARHEICDDLHSIGHELQKHARPRRILGAKWCPPTRSRLPRRRSTRRGR